MVKKLKKVAEGFKDFAFKDAVLGTAVGIMLGTALKDVINSLIDNILMPPIAYITSGIDFSQLYMVIGRTKYESLETAKEAGALVLTYGQFINSFVSFIILALVLYFLTTFVLKQFKKDDNKKEKKKTTKQCPYCITTIDIKATRCPNCTSKL
jgi:large conductance mechanosensitive channel